MVVSDLELKDYLGNKEFIKAMQNISKYSEDRKVLVDKANEIGEEIGVGSPEYKKAHEDVVHFEPPYTEGEMFAILAYQNAIAFRPSILTFFGDLYPETVKDFTSMFDKLGVKQFVYTPTCLPGEEPVYGETSIDTLTILCKNGWNINGMAEYIDQHLGTDYYGKGFNIVREQKGE